MPHLCLLLVFLCCSLARGQELKVSLMTVGPGEEVYELFGHNAIVFQDTQSGDVWAYHWGMFRFDEPNFVGKFIMGRMTYSIARDDADHFEWSLRVYEQQRRSVTLTELNLSPDQQLKLLTLCEENWEPANRLYRYDYYRDNCSTRVRDMLDRATDGQIAAGLKGKPATGNFRWHTNRLAQRAPWLYVGLHYVLGHPVDEPISAWDEGFLPGRLKAHLEGVSLNGVGSESRPLLGMSRAIVPDVRGGEPESPPRWWPWFGLAGLLWGGAIVGLVTRQNRWARRLGWALVLGWAGLCVLGGGISTWGWAFTDHAASRYNENWLQLSPLSLPIMVASVLALFGRRPRWGKGAAITILGLSVLGVLIKILPVMDQPNGSIILLALPLHLAVTWAFVTLSRKPI